MAENLGTKRVKLGGQFEIEVKANPLGGYIWNEVIDKKTLELQSKKFYPLSTGFGAGGKQIFVFRALKPGHTTVRLVYGPPKKMEINDEKDLEVIID